MGTEARIVLYAPAREHAERAANDAFARIAVLDSLLSDYRDDGELARVHEAAGGNAIRVSHELIHVMTYALQIARETHGAFDPTSAPVTQLWRTARRTRSLPHPDSIAIALKRVGWKYVNIDTAERTIRLARDGMRLDLGGIAKGYAVDEVLATLRKHSIERALITFGGEIAAGKAPPRDTAWLIQLDSTTTEHSDTGRGNTVPLVQAALSTSGDTEQFLEIDGTRYSHVIDPRTGQPLTNRNRATVLAPTAMQADALATAATILRPNERAAFIAAHPEATFRLFGTDFHR